MLGYCMGEKRAEPVIDAVCSALCVHDVKKLITNGLGHQVEIKKVADKASATEPRMTTIFGPSCKFNISRALLSQETDIAALLQFL